MFKDSIKTGDVVIALYKLSHVQILSLKNSNFVTDTIQSFIYESFYIGGYFEKNSKAYHFSLKYLFRSDSFLFRARAKLTLPLTIHFVFVVFAEKTLTLSSVP